MAHHRALESCLSLLPITESLLVLAPKAGWAAYRLGASLAITSLYNWLSLSLATLGCLLGLTRKWLIKGDTREEQGPSKEKCRQEVKYAKGLKAAEGPSSFFPRCPSLRPSLPPSLMCRDLDVAGGVWLFLVVIPSCFSR